MAAPACSPLGTATCSYISNKPLPLWHGYMLSNPAGPTGPTEAHVSSESTYLGASPSRSGQALEGISAACSQKKREACPEVAWDAHKREETGLHLLLHSVARVVVRLLVTVNTHRVVLEGLLLLEQVVYSIDLKVNPKRRIAGVAPPTRYI
jgi:hypothetical protein